MKLNHIHTKFVAVGFHNKLHNNNNNTNTNTNKKHKFRRVSTSRFSTKTHKQNPPSLSSNSSPDSLFQRIQVVRDPKASVLPVLRQWVSQGRLISEHELAWIVRIMRGFKRFHHALQISMWMSDNMYLKISPEDAAIRLDLIHRVHGLECAENYFNAMSVQLKTYSVHGSLLRSYVRENRADRAEAVMRGMRNMGAKESSFPYNVLIGLYAKNGEVDKIDRLMREMETKGIPHDAYTLRNRMSACIAASDVRGMEKTMSRLVKDDRNIFVHWKVYSLAATGYLKLGLSEKALEMLWRLEGEIRKLNPESRRTAFMFLLTLYSGARQKDELFRVWDLYKPSDGGIGIDAVYACMIRSLTKLDDIEGAERVFEEWELRCTNYEFRVVNSILAAYCKEGLLNKAESTLERAMDGGTRTPYTSTWNILANGYAAHNNLAKAVETLTKGLSADRKGWMPNSVTLSACLEYLKEQGDVVGMEEMISLVKNLDVLSEDTYTRLVNVCYAAGESFSEVLSQSENDSTSDVETNESDDETV